MSSRDWYLYTLRCADDTLYTGVTTDVLRRLREHNSGRGARYTSARRPVRLIGVWQFADRSAAQRAEARFRKLPRRRKLQHVARELPIAQSPFYRDRRISEEIHPIRFCDLCGGLLSPFEHPDDDRRRQTCTVCGHIRYRNAKPCAGALVQRDGRLLLVKRAIDPYVGCWDIPGGFLEADEHPRSGAIREVEEETGLVIELTELFGIYLGRYRYEEKENYVCLNLYYSASVVGGKAQASDDAAELAWFAPEDLPDAVAFDHARRVLADWAASKTQGRHGPSASHP